MTKAVNLGALESRRAAMTDSNPKHGLSTTPADLCLGIDAVLERCFRGLDEGDEAQRLGVSEDVIRQLREGLQDLRDIAARAQDRATD